MRVGDTARRWLIGAPVAVNALMFAVSVGATGEIEAGHRTTGTPRVVRESTIHFRATDPEDEALMVTCTLPRPDPGTDGPLEVAARALDEHVLALVSRR